MSEIKAACDTARLQKYMNMALEEAKKAYIIGEVPVGAVIVKDDNIIAKAHNTVEQDNNSTRHAEMNVIRIACEKLKVRSLHECEVYVTLEPCAMCTGAIMQARVGKLYFGAKDDTAGAVLSKIQLLDMPLGNRKTEYYPNILEEECRILLTSFFSEVRTKFALMDGINVYKVSKNYFDNDTVLLAKALLGSYIVRHINGERLVAEIIETEAYCGIEDKGSHSFGGNRTPRTEVMFGPAGHAYIYLIYGMYNCLNFVTRPEGIPSAVLIRSVRPVEGFDTMAKLRFGTNDLDKKKKLSLTNGPGKLCMALGLTKQQNGLDLTSDELYIVRPHKFKTLDIVTTKRINIDYAEEAVHYPWRFYIKDNPYVSKK